MRGFSHRLRKGRLPGTERQDRLHDGPRPSTRPRARVYEVAGRRVSESVLGIRELLDRQLDRIEALYERGENVTGVPTGFVDLDIALSGCSPRTWSS